MPNAESSTGQRGMVDAMADAKEFSAQLPMKTIVRSQRCNGGCRPGPCIQPPGPPTCMPPPGPPPRCNQRMP